MSSKHLGLFPTWTHGYCFGNVTCEGRYYLPYIKQQILERHQGRAAFVQAKLASLRDLFDPEAAAGREFAASGPAFDAVVDCCGLGASQLLGDKEVGEWAEG